MIPDKEKHIQFLEGQVCNLKKRLNECMRISAYRKTKVFNLLTEIKKLRTIIIEYRAKN